MPLAKLKGRRMKSDRVLILSVVFLAAGLGWILNYCHGDAGFNAALPAAGASLRVCLTTTGLPAMGGFALTVFGLLLLIGALIAAIARQLTSPRGTSGR